MILENMNITGTVNLECVHTSFVHMNHFIIPARPELFELFHPRLSSPFIRCAHIGYRIVIFRRNPDSKKNNETQENTRRYRAAMINGHEKLKILARV